MRTEFLLGKRKQFKNSSWYNGNVKPGTKFWKRIANKKIRKLKLFDGSYYKKMFGWMEWS